MTTARPLMSSIKSNDTWLSRLVPFGLVGQTKPRHYREMLGAVWENRKEIPYAWNVLNHGVYDRCSLGPYGLRDNVIDGTYLATGRSGLGRTGKNVVGHPTISVVYLRSDW